MKGTVILSTTDGGDYLPYLEYCQKAWNKLGWNTLTFYMGKVAPKGTKQNRVLEIPKELLDYGYREATLVQVARLFGGHYCNGMVMTGDVDMLPMSNYWRPGMGDVTVYGHDLTDYTQYPICYIAMHSDIWKKVIHEDGVIELLDKYKDIAKSEEFYTWWGVDQHIITERIDKVIQPGKLIKVMRGKEHGLAKGRVDRADWQGTLSRAGLKIDAHMPRPFNAIEAQRILNLCQPI